MNLVCPSLGLHPSLPHLLKPGEFPMDPVPRREAHSCQYDHRAGRDRKRHHHIPGGISTLLLLLLLTLLPFRSTSHRRRRSSTLHHAQPLDTSAPLPGPWKPSRGSSTRQQRRQASAECSVMFKFRLANGGTIENRAHVRIPLPFPIRGRLGFEIATTQWERGDECGDVFALPICLGRC
ncbi:hypothetical protein K440DRAFT_632569 [Wilcoxina mikolae CBS 423.85]|nr:hypothetical protein K440DRAFT_632569 [Wilcoxina mikolae CBS 423.85]